MRRSSPSLRLNVLPLLAIGLALVQGIGELWALQRKRVALRLR